MRMIKTFYIIFIKLIGNKSETFFIQTFFYIDPQVFNQFFFFYAAEY